MSKVVVDLEASRRKKTTIGELIVSQAKLIFWLCFPCRWSTVIFIYFLCHMISVQTEVTVFPFVTSDAVGKTRDEKNPSSSSEAVS
jgi:hypothetical protein